jgi:nicotinate-nucleotide--dimethylbenzimidazole phosphoribosyltransferase
MQQEGRPVAQFDSITSIRNAVADLPGADETARQAAEDRNAVLTKPPAALGRLEDLAIWYAAWRANPRPTINAPQIVIFAGNHGVAAQGVSAFPPEVTEQMVLNFQAGGAAINQLAKLHGCTMDVFSLDLDRPTADFTTGPAMTEEELVDAFNIGWHAVRDDADLLVVGEMGIGNTTAAAAISAALVGGTGAEWVGVGTGVAEDGLALKARVVDKGLAANSSRDPIDILGALGGREIAAMAAAMLRARHLRIPLIIDGFICSSAAAALHAANNNALDHAVAGHVSAEQAHARLLDFIGKTPLLSLGMRLGEGSGAAVAIGVLKAAIACHSGMATFAEAGVSDA